MPPTIYTIGHSTRTLADLISLLQENNITALIDVRAYPRSRRHPHFNTEALPEPLANAGIAYHHAPALGGRRPSRNTEAPSPNNGWDNPSFRNYADYALTPPFRAALDDLRTRSAASVCCIMCSEAVWWRCHRRIIADNLLANSINVIHILAPNHTEPATLTPFAQLQPDTTLHYPSPTPPLFSPTSSH